MPQPRLKGQIVPGPVVSKAHKTRAVTRQRVAGVVRKVPVKAPADNQVGQVAAADEVVVVDPDDSDLFFCNPIVIVL